MFRSNRDIEVYIREMEDLAPALYGTVLDSLDDDNRILAARYMTREMMWKLILPACTVSGADSDSRIAERIAASGLTERMISPLQDTVSHPSTDRLPAPELAGYFLELWRELSRRTLITRILGERLTMLRDFCLDPPCLRTPEAEAVLRQILPFLREELLAPEEVLDACRRQFPERSSGQWQHVLLLLLNELL